MDYTEFLEYIRCNIAQRMQQRDAEHAVYDVNVNKIVKNNGVELDGLTIRKRGDLLSPNIYMNRYYEQYQMGQPIQCILDQIINYYEESMQGTEFQMEDLFDFAAVKERIVLRLINYDKNREQLADCPHIRFLDLAITFRYMVDKDQLGIASSIISNAEFSHWNITVEELYRTALPNTMREFPWQMDSLAAVIAECLRREAKDMLSDSILEQIREIEAEENRVTLYVLTNDAGINGATCMLYEHVIRDFAKVQESNIFILPSSIHEVMLVPEEEETEPEFLKELVKDANRTAVGYIDLLSDSVYVYDRASDSIRIYGEETA